MDFGACIEQHPEMPRREPARDAHLSGVEDRIGLRGLVIEAGRVGDLQLLLGVQQRGSGQRPIGLLRDAQVGALGADVFEFHEQAMRKVF